MNIKNFEKVLKTIKKNPNQWRQATWHCGTQHCFAGWAQVLSGKKADSMTVAQDALSFLGISENQGDWLFDPARLITDFEEFLKRAKTSAARKAAKKAKVETETEEPTRVFKFVEEEQHVSLSR